MEKQYVEHKNEDYWIIGTRISLTSVIMAFLEGLSPEAIVSEGYPTLTLEQVYGAITYYLSHRREVNIFLHQTDADFEVLRQATHDPVFADKIAKARRELLLASS